MNVMNNSYFYLDYYSEIVEKELHDARNQIDVSKESNIEKKSSRKLLKLFKKRPAVKRKNQMKNVQMDKSDACICA